MKYLRFGFFILGVGVFILVFRRAASGDFSVVLSSLDWRFALAAFAAYCAENVARVERLLLVLRGKIPRRDLYALVFTQNFFNVFLSFSGDAAYVSLLHRKKAVAFAENLSSLITVKVFDLAALAGFFFVSIFFSTAERLASFRLPALVVFIASCVLIASIAVYSRVVSAWIGRLRDHGAMRNYPTARAWLNAVRAFVGELGMGVSLFDRRDALIRIIVATLVNWLFTFSCGFFLLRGAGIAIGFGAVIFVYTLPIIVSLTPAFVFGGFGSFEAALVAGLVLVGIGSSSAFSASIAIHLEELLFVGVSGAAGFVLQGYFWPHKRV